MNNKFIGKIMLYMSAALIFAATPTYAHAAEETTQIIEIQEENIPNTNTPPESDTPNEDIPADNTIATPLPEPVDNGGITPMQATVYAATKSGLNVRSGPSTSHDKIGKLEYGQAISVTGVTADNWYQIQYSGGTGYVLAEYVSSAPIANTGAAPDVTPADAATSGTSAAAPDIDSDTPADTVPSILPTETDTSNFDEETGRLIGTPIIIILAIAIFGVLALIGFSVYSMFKKDNNYTDYEYYEDDYYEDDQFTDDEYYEDEQYSYDEYYEDEQYSDDEYYESDYYEDEQPSDDEYYEDDDRK